MSGTSPSNPTPNVRFGIEVEGQASRKPKLGEPLQCCREASQCLFEFGPGLGSGQRGHPRPHPRRPLSIKGQCSFPLKHGRLSGSCCIQLQWAAKGRSSCHMEEILLPKASPGVANKFSHWASFLASQKPQTFCIWFTLKMLNRHPDEELLVAMRGQAILGGATISLVCNGRGLWCSQIGSLHRSGGGTALVDAMFRFGTQKMLPFTICAWAKDSPPMGSS